MILTKCELDTCKCVFVLRYDDEGNEFFHESISICDEHNHLSEYESVIAAIEKNRNKSQ